MALRSATNSPLRRLMCWLFAAAVMVTVIKTIWPLLAVGALGYAVWLPVRARRRRIAGLRARADWQHQQVMVGNPAGIYGSPVTR
jgi:hypothetical protein